MQINFRDGDDINIEKVNVTKNLEEAVCFVSQVDKLTELRGGIANQTERKR